MKEIEEIDFFVKNSLSKERYEHSKRVAEEAKKLAIHYHYDPEKAYLAGLVHDVAKEYTKLQNEEIIKKYQLSQDLLKDYNKKILHSYIGAIVVKEKFHLSDEICDAIKRHTLGDIPMTLLDKIIFVADKIDPKRRYKQLEEERKMAYTNLTQATILCIKNNLKSLEEKKQPINKRSVEILKYLEKEQIKN